MTINNEKHVATKNSVKKIIIHFVHFILCSLLSLLSTLWFIGTGNV